MPIYEFLCRECHRPFEVVQPMSKYDPTRVECPHCHGRSLERRWSGVSTITSKKS